MPEGCYRISCGAGGGKSEVSWDLVDETSGAVLLIGRANNTITQQLK